MSDQKYLQNPSIKTSYVVHIPESTLTDDSAYIQGMANEGINIFLDSFMPTVLEKKKRSVGTDGNINFTKTDINGLALELFKEMMSDIFSITIVSAKDRYPSPIMVAEIRAASYDGRFSSTNTPDYARKYFGRILSEYGFPPLGDQTE